MKTMICFDNMAYCHFNYEAVDSINKCVLDSNEEISIVALDSTVHFMDVNTAIYHAAELDSFNNGIIIAHTIKNCKEILSCSNNSKKLLYLYDLDWMYEKMSYDEIYDVLNDENLILVLRSESHVKPVKNLCGREPNAIMGNFELEKIWNLL
jgi:hypothetical protein